MEHHELKCRPEYFSRIVSGQKTFEVRKNDRNYQVGDYVSLIEYSPVSDKAPTIHRWDSMASSQSRTYEAEIVYIETYAQQDGYVVLGIRPAKVNEKQK